MNSVQIPSQLFTCSTKMEPPTSLSFIVYARTNLRTAAQARKCYVMQIMVFGMFAVLLFRDTLYTK